MILNLWNSCGSYGHEQLDSKVKVTRWNSCIQIFSFSYLLPQNSVHINSWCHRIPNWTQRLFLNSTLNSLFDVNYEFKSYGSIYEGSRWYIKIMNTFSSLSCSLTWVLKQVSRSCRRLLKRTRRDSLKRFGRTLKT